MTQHFYIYRLPLFTKDHVKALSHCTCSFFNVARYAIPVVCNANRVVRYAISVLREGGNLHFGQYCILRGGGLAIERNFLVAPVLLFFFVVVVALNFSLF